MASIARTPAGAAAILPPSLRARLIGLGSIFGKTVRDSRRAAIVVAGIAVLILVAAGAGIKTAYPTILSRQQLVDLAASTPAIFDGLVGKAVNVGTLGGFVAWKYGVVFPLLAGLWSILALSGTLAAEVNRGSMDIVASAPYARRRIAAEKVGGHVAVMTLAMAVVALGAWLTGQAFGSLPGDAIPLEAAVGFAVWLGFISILAGSIAFVLSAFLGRGAAAGLAGAIMFTGYVLNGYQVAVPVFAGPAQLSWFAWTANHNPLAGQEDWPSLVPVAVLAAAFLALGVLAFARRDLGAPSLVRLPGLPAAVAGVHGPTGRQFGQLIPAAISWGIGLGLFGLLISSSSRSFAAELAKSPDLIKIIKTIFPAYDLTSPGGFLTLVFMAYGLVLAGFAATTFISNWASDESSGRLEMILATPLARARWAWRSGLGVYLAIALVTVLTAVGIAIGAGSAGGDLVAPVSGTLILGLYAGALAGVGFAAGGLFGASKAALVVGVLVVATFLIDFLSPALGLPDWVHGLALSSHVGQPLVGIWDWGGVAGCVVLAIGGLALGAWGYTRRDIAR